MSRFSHSPRASPRSPSRTLLPPGLPKQSPLPGGMQALLLHHPPKQAGPPQQWCRWATLGGVSRRRSITFPDGECSEINQKGNK